MKLQKIGKLQKLQRGENREKLTKPNEIKC